MSEATTSGTVKLLDENLSNENTKPKSDQTVLKETFDQEQNQLELEFYENVDRLTSQYTAAVNWFVVNTEWQFDNILANMVKALNEARERHISDEFKNFRNRMIQRQENFNKACEAINEKCEDSLQSDVWYWDNVPECVSQVKIETKKRLDDMHEDIARFIKIACDETYNFEQMCKYILVQYDEFKERVQKLKTKPDVLEAKQMMEDEEKKRTRKKAKAWRRWFCGVFE